MRPCLYITLYRGALEYMEKRWPRHGTAWFGSRKGWPGAAKLIPMPVLIRAIGEDGQGGLACTYRAELVAIEERIGRSVAERLRWLRGHKTMQRAQREAEGWPPEKFEEKEIKHALQYATHYCVKGLERIAPIPLGRLVKWHDRERLAASYRYGYVFCVYPETLIRIRPRGVDRTPDRSLEPSELHGILAGLPRSEVPPILEDIRRIVRDRMLRPKVLRLWKPRCAACGMRLELGRDAECEVAHIIPVQLDPARRDDVRNAFPLCRTHHWAFDHHLWEIRPHDMALWVRPAFREHQALRALHEARLRVPSASVAKTLRYYVRKRWRMFRAGRQ